jgi:7-cyano-7-deazaguanine synthase in queuosine biosynthesis
MDVSKDLHHTVTGSLGPAGISSVAADLLDVAAAVFRCERLLKVPGSTNRYTVFQLSMPLRNPRAWTGGAATSLAQALEILGNAKWSFSFSSASVPIPDHTMASKGKTKDRVVLFSGGLDSTCGLAVQGRESDKTLLNSYYTRQKRKQSEIATALGYKDHVQWRLAPQSGPGRSFFYRSFYFLSLAAVVAQSWRIRRLTQFETGILAYAVPPSPWYAMTKHAHPKFLSIASRLYEQLFGGGPWMIENPFMNLTKREEVAAAVRCVGSRKASELFMKTETCWSQWACHVHGLGKKPGVPCGVCIPCIIRRTALPSDLFRIDLTKRKHQNHEKMGQAFRSYLAFLETVLSCGSADRFYTLLPVHVRQLVPSSVKLETVHGLFVRFGKEFMKTFFP